MVSLVDMAGVRVRVTAWGSLRVRAARAVRGVVAGGDRTRRAYAHGVHTVLGCGVSHGPFKD
eukprot:2155188-Rhodomonas_salina.3